MKYYTSSTQFNCGIDLHARQMYVCLMDRDGKKLVHTNIKNNDFDFFLWNERRKRFGASASDARPQKTGAARSARYESGSRHRVEWTACGRTAREFLDRAAARPPKQRTAKDGRWIAALESGLRCGGQRPSALARSMESE